MSKRFEAFRQTTIIIAILCIISGVIAALPLVVAVIIGLGSLFGKAKKKENKNTEKENEN